MRSLHGGSYNGGLIVVLTLHRGAAAHYSTAVHVFGTELPLLTILGDNWKSAGHVHGDSGNN